jgi:hypothetical protein
MATYWLALQDKNTTPGTPEFVWLKMTSPLWGDDTWSIFTPNSWIGHGGGTYQNVEVIPRTTVLKFFDGSGALKFDLYTLNYPDDCNTSDPIKTGRGLYLSPYILGGALRLEWSNRNIIPDHW